ncbi:MAG: tetratricopeptide repeat protein [Gammaproteobacteria bacterium]|nr:tetratricopeptide repeat protein [Gammaproteobacteria bacterium]MBU1653844.1 tetratricopeptide repeat protein [Gammaproteobacteria bacterium]MBU1961031.1 tetratricopeptide repeat protein [Gammaproteobacteria bacterium]
MARKPKKNPHSGPRPEAHRLQAIDKLLEQGRFEEALEHADRALKVFPGIGGFYHQRIDALESLDRPLEAELTAYHWTQARPGSIRAWSSLLSFSVDNNHPLLSYHAAVHYNALAEGTDEIPYPILPEFERSIEEGGISPYGDGHLSKETAFLVELAEICIQTDAFEEGIEILLKADNAPPLRNNLGICLFHLGRLDEALACFNENWAREPRNLFALGWIVKLRLLLGREEAAVGLLPPLVSAIPLRDEDLIAQISVLLLLGREQDALRAFEAGIRQPWWRNGVFHRLGMIKHLGAVCHLRAGKIKAARKLWREALDEAPDLDLARENLADLEREQRERNGPWLLPLIEYLPKYWLNKLQAGFQDRSDEDNKKRLVATCGAVSNAYLQALSAIGDSMTLQFCAWLLHVRAQQGDKEAREGLLAILRSPQGSLQDHLDLATRMREQGILAVQEAVEIWNGEELQPVRLQGYKVSGEARPSKLTKPQMDLLGQALAAIRGKDYQRAKGILEGLSKKVPGEGMIWNNLAVVHSALGNDREVERMLHQAVEADSSNVIGRCNLAMHYIGSGDKERAKALLMDLPLRDELHIQEAIAGNGVNAVLLASEGRFEEAEKLLEALRPMAEEYKLLARLDDYARLVRKMRGGLLQRMLKAVKPVR